MDSLKTQNIMYFAKDCSENWSNYRNQFNRKYLEGIQGGLI